MTLELPLDELLEKLAQYDEVTLLELLEVTSYDLVQYLEDLIIAKQDELRVKLQDDDEEED